MTQRSSQQKSCCVHSVFQTAGTPCGCSALEHMHAREPLLPAELLCLGSLLLICFNVSRGETLIPQLSRQLGRWIFVHNRGEIVFKFIFKNYFFWRLCLWNASDSWPPAWRLLAPPFLPAWSLFSSPIWVTQWWLPSILMRFMTIPQRSPVFLCRALQAAMLHQRPAAHIPVSGTAPMQASRYSTSICVHCVESCHQVLLLFFFSLCDQDGNSYLHLYFKSWISSTPCPTISVHFP